MFYSIKILLVVSFFVCSASLNGCGDDLGSFPQNQFYLR